MSERVSALMDGEVDPSAVGYSLKRLAADAKLRRTWDTYHLIGDVLRGDLVPQYADKVEARLSDEPTVLAPRRHGGRSAQRAGWWAMSLAAGAAAVVLVAWMALPQRGPEQPPIASAGPVPAPQPQPAPVATEVEDYLLAHQRFSPSGAMQGVASYVRTVADEARR